MEQTSRFTKAQPYPRFGKPQQNSSWKKNHKQKWESSSKEIPSKEKCYKTEASRYSITVFEIYPKEQRQENNRSLLEDI